MRQGRTAVGFALGDLAERTGLEPATPGVTGRYSNQLNYRSRKNDEPFWWVLTGSNRRHSPCKGDALPTELSTRIFAKTRILAYFRVFSQGRWAVLHCPRALDQCFTASVAAAG